MSTNENNSEVAVEKVTEEKTADAKSDLKGTKRAAEVRAHVIERILIITRHFIERCNNNRQHTNIFWKTLILMPIMV